jgi:hypothetical protein
MMDLRHKFGVALAVGAARMLSSITGHRIITFQIEPRAGGYFFVRSHDLPGFTMMLEPGEADSPKVLVEALYEPVTAYLEAESKSAGRTPRRTDFRGRGPASKPIRVMGSLSDDEAIAVARA